MLASSESAMQIPEESLLARCRDGNLEAFGLVYADYEQAIYRHAYHLLGDAEEAHDVRQETFLKAFVAIGSFRGESGLKTWLLKICTNLCRNRQRTTQRRREVSYESTSGLDYLIRENPVSDPAAIAQKKAMASLMRQALDEISPAHRELIVLRDIEELDADETAAILGCSKASLAVKLFRARSSLRARVKFLLREES